MAKRPKSYVARHDGRIIWRGYADSLEHARDLAANELTVEEVDE